MPRNGSGVYSLPAGNPVVSGTVIESTWANNTLSDISSAITGSLARDGTGGMTGSFKLVDGSASLPGLAFTNEPSTGWYRGGAGEMWASVLTSPIFQVSGTGLSLASSKVLSLQAGAVGAPALTFTSDNDTGVWSPGADIVAVAAGGVERLRLNNTGASITGTLGVSGAVTLSSTLAVTGNATVGGTLGVTGVATLTANPVLNGGTANSVQYLNGSKVLSSDANFVYTSTGLGVGTSSIARKLHIVDDTNETQLLLREANGSGPQMLIGVDSTAGGSIINASTQTGAFANLYLQTGGNTRATLDSAGNLGLGVTPSAWGSSWKAVDISPVGAIASQPGTLRIWCNGYQDASANRYKTTGFASAYNQESGQHAWYTAPSGTAGNAITFTPAMTLTAVGDLSLGTTGSEGRLNVRPTSNAPNTICLLGDGNTLAGAIGFDSATGGVGNMRLTANNALTLSTNNTERARITADGGITSTAKADAMGYKGVPSVATSGTTASTADIGRCYVATGGVTIPASTFAAGDTFSIYNNTAGNITITQGASLTLRQVATANTGNRTLAQRGLCTVMFISATEAVISGAGLT
jgi:hypothetical protein